MLLPQITRRYDRWYNLCKMATELSRLYFNVSTHSLTWLTANTFKCLKTFSFYFLTSKVKSLIFLITIKIITNSTKLLPTNVVSSTILGIPCYVWFLWKLTDNRRSRKKQKKLTFSVLLLRCRSMKLPQTLILEGRVLLANT